MRPQLAAALLVVEMNQTDLFAGGQTSGDFELRSYLKASNPGISDKFGRAVALHGDDVMVGAFAAASTALTRPVRSSQASAAASSSSAIAKRRWPLTSSIPSECSFRRMATNPTF